jgi:hypothetical protein
VDGLYFISSDNAEYESNGKRQNWGSSKQAVKPWLRTGFSIKLLKVQPDEIGLVKTPPVQFLPLFFSFILVRFFPVPAYMAVILPVLLHFRRHSD